jgi:hypothetical protein
MAALRGSLRKVKVNQREQSPWYQLLTVSFVSVGNIQQSIEQRVQDDQGAPTSRIDGDVATCIYERSIDEF